MLEKENGANLQEVSKQGLGRMFIGDSTHAKPHSTTNGDEATNPANTANFFFKEEKSKYTNKNREGGYQHTRL